MVGALIAITHVAQADVPGLGLQFAIAIGAASQAVERVVGDVELHHPPAQLFEARRMGAHNHALFGRGRTGGRCSSATLNLDEAEAAGSEGFHTVGRAKFRYRIVDGGGRSHHGRSGRHADFAPIDRERHRRGAGADRRARIEFLQDAHHDLLLLGRDPGWRFLEIFLEMIERASNRQWREAAKRA